LNTAEKTGQIYADFTYKGFYPVFKIEANAGKRATDYMVITNIIDRNGKVIDHDTTIKRFTRKETNFSFDTKVPLNLSTGKYNRLLQPGLIYDYTFIKQDSNKYKDLFNGQIQSITYNLYYHHLINESHRDLLPYFGVVVDLKFRHTPWGNRDLGTISCAQAILYLPGLVANHGIRIYNGFQKKNPAKDFHAFGDLIRYPRGWSSFSNNEIYSLGLDYKFPITYPDCRLLKTIYIQRLKCSLFNDYAFSEGNVYSQGKVVGIIKKSVSSFGAELTGDLNIVRFYAPVEMGVRAGFIPGKGSFFNFLFSVDFSSF
jgi:hypothetical protein